MPKTFLNLHVFDELNDSQDFIIGLINDEFEIEAIWQEDDSMLVSFDQTKISKDALIESLISILPKGNYEIKIEEDKNWNEEFESSFQPIELKDRSWGVRASFHDTLSTDNELIINPKMSFGTGHHETTRQMMEMMVDMDFKDKQVWDYGSGTGILAILAAKLGAKEVYANDNEEWAYHNSIENKSLNQVDFIQFEYGTIEELKDKSLKNKTFDIILANITKNILIQSALDINFYSKHNSTLIISGFYSSDIPDLVDCFGQYSFQLENQSQENQWACLKFIKK